MIGPISEQALPLRVGCHAVLAAALPTGGMRWRLHAHIWARHSTKPQEKYSLMPANQSISSDAMLRHIADGNSTGGKCSTCSIDDRKRRGPAARLCRLVPVLCRLRRCQCMLRGSGAIRARPVPQARALPLHRRLHDRLPVRGPGAVRRRPCLRCSAGVLLRRCHRGLLLQCCLLRLVPA